MDNLPLRFGIWLDRETRGSEQRPDEPIIGETQFAGQRIPVQRFMALPPGGETTGDIGSMAMLVGQSAGLVRDIKPAATLVHEFGAEAQQLIAQRLLTFIQG